MYVILFKKIIDLVVIAQSLQSMLLYRGGPERMGPSPPPWVPLLKGSSILSISLCSKNLNTSSLGLGESKLKTW